MNPPSSANGLSLRPAGKGRQTRRRIGPQRHLLHQRLAECGDHRDHVRLVDPVQRDVLIKFPQRTLQCQSGVVGQNLVHRAQFDRDRAEGRGQKESGRIGKGVKGGQSLGRQQFGEFCPPCLRQTPFKIGLLQLHQTRLHGKALTHRKGDGKAAAQGLQRARLLRRDQTIAQPLDPLHQPHAAGSRGRTCHKARRGGPESRARADAGRAFERRSLGRPPEAGRVVKAGQQGQGRLILCADGLFLQFHRVARGHGASLRLHRKHAKCAAGLGPRAISRRALGGAGTRADRPFSIGSSYLTGMMRPPAPTTNLRTSRRPGGFNSASV